MTTYIVSSTDEDTISLPPTLSDLGALPLHYGNKHFPHLLALHWLSGRGCPWRIVGDDGCWHQRMFVGACWTRTGYRRDSAHRKRFSRLRPVWRRVYRLVSGVGDLSDNALPSDVTIATELRDADEATAKIWWLWALAADKVFQQWSVSRRRVGGAPGIDSFGHDNSNVMEIQRRDKGALWDTHVRLDAPEGP